MEKELNHECIICGEKYHYCNDCGKMKSFTPWRTVCDTAQHYQIYMTLYDIDSGAIGKKEAKERFNSMGITADNLSDLKTSVQEVIIDILAVEPSSYLTEDVQGLDKVKTFFKNKNSK